MTELYIINKTDGSTLTGLAPGEYDGPQSARQSTDLRLYGSGHTQWGEGMDENLVHLLETHACPESVTNPGNPMTSSELGSVGGINVPVEGQLWFNTTSKRVYVYTKTGVSTFEWKPVGASFGGPGAPDNPEIGWLWYDTTVPQVKVWTGTAWDSVAKRYVLKTGDDMSGNLNMTGTSAITFPQGSSAGGLVFDSLGQKRVAWNDGADLSLRAGHSVSGSPAGEKYIVTGDGAAKLVMTSDGAAGAITMSVAGTGTAGSTVTFGNYLTIDTGAITLGGNAAVTGTLGVTGAASVSGGTLSLVNGVSNTILWNTAGVAAPSFTTRSIGTKLVLYPSLSGSSADYAVGIDGNIMWSSIPNNSNTQYFKWFGGTTEAMKLTGTGNLTAIGTIEGNKLKAVTIEATNNGAADNYLVGNDAYIGDVNIANTLCIRGAQDSTQGNIQFGSSGTKGTLFYNGASFSFNKNLSTTGSMTSNSLAVTGTGASVAGNTIWHGGNDGSGSGLDADLLDGHHWNEISGLIPVVPPACKGVQVLQWTGAVVANNNPQNTWKNLAGASHVITVPSNASYIYVLWTGNAEFNSHQYSVVWRLTLNGNQIGIEDDTQGASVAPDGLSFGQKITISAAFPISPGSYTIQLQAYSYDNVGTVTTNMRHTPSGHPNAGAHTLTVMYF